MRGADCRSAAGRKGVGLPRADRVLLPWVHQHRLAKYAKVCHHKGVAMSLNVSLPAELENRVREHVASGMYGSASEVIREALRLFEAYQAVRVSTLEALKVDIAQGLADRAAGRVDALDVEAIKAKGREVLSAKTAR